MAKKRIKPSQAPSKGAHVASHAASAGTTNHLTPIFCLQYLGGAYCLSHCEREEKAAFADTLHRLGRMTWNEIQRAHHHGAGCEIISRDAIGNLNLPAEVTEDVNLLAFRFCAMAPMVGYRNGRVFTILFLDRNFTLYDHG